LSPSQAGLVELRAQRTSAGLVISLYNDGPGIAPGVLRDTAANDAPGPDAGSRDAPATKGDGRSGSIGLTNVRNRLRGLYGAEASLDVANIDGCGVRVTIHQPWRESADTGSGMQAA
jgi:LytS/YehU family sensor histidine kinase